MLCVTKGLKASPSMSIGLPHLRVPERGETLKPRRLSDLDEASLVSRYITISVKVYVNVKMYVFHAVKALKPASSVLRAVQ
jgi:hypothetical protein